MTALEKDGEFFDFDQSIILKKEVKALNALTASSTFSYSATMPDTAINRRLLGIESWDVVKPIYQAIPITLHLNQIKIQVSLQVEGIDDGITFNLFTDNFDFFTQLTGVLREVQFQEYPFGTASDRRANEHGYLDIMVNNGINKFSLTGSFAFNFVPCFYVKDIIRDILNSLAIKLDGDILKDWRYNHLLISNDSVNVHYDETYIMDHTVFVGKSDNQSITGATRVLFPLESGIFYDNPVWWDSSVSELQVEQSRNIAWEINLIFNRGGLLSGHTVSIIDDLGTTIDTITMGVGDESISWSDVSVMLPTRQYHVTVIPDAGTITCSNSSTAKFMVCNEAYNSGILVKFTVDEMLPRFLMPDMDTRDFVQQIFNMFNPIINFNPINKRLTVNLFDNIKTNEEEDWTTYLKSYKIDSVSLVREYAKRSFLLYDEGDEQFLEDYNKRQPIPYGGGVLEVDNDFIEDETDVLSISFPPTLQELNNAAQAYLPTMECFDVTVSEENLFSHRLLLGIANYPVSNFSNLTSIGGQTALPYGWFAKPNVRKGVDVLKLNLAFDNPALSGFDGITLKQSYFKQIGRTLNDPFTVIATMTLPEKVFHNFDPSTPKRLHTKDFNALFFVKVIEGWESGFIDCEVELIKL